MYRLDQAIRAAPLREKPSCGALVRKIVHVVQTDVLCHLRPCVFQAVTLALLAICLLDRICLRWCSGFCYGTPVRASICGDNVAVLIHFLE